MPLLPKIGVPLALAAGIVIGGGIAITHGVLADHDASVTETFPRDELLNFADILNKIKTQYVEPVDDKKLIEGAVRGMLDNLDPHSSYLDKDEFKEMNTVTTGKYGGLGIEVQPQSGVIRVVAPIDDTPAARAGILPGDLIVKIDEARVQGMTVNDAVGKMKGDPGTKVKLTIIRESAPQPIVLELKREIIKLASVKGKMMEAGLGYIRISQFQVDTGKGLDEEIGKLKTEAGGKLKGLILDLRNNPGGVLGAAVDVSDAFVEKGVIVSMKGRVPDSNREFDATPGDELDGAPLVVLVNGGSASASEIVAGALQDDHRAIIVGTKTFGKGSVQTIEPLQNGGAIRLTTARYYTPSGRSIQAEGVTPDVVITPLKISKDDDGKSDPETVHEADLARRLDNPDLKDKSPDKAGPATAVGGTPDVDPRKLAESDYSLFEALNLLKGLTIASTIK